MTPRLLMLSLCLTLAACAHESGPVEPYAFVGTWDCGVDTFTFTNTSYTNSSGSYPIHHVARDDRNYSLRFGNGYLLMLAAVTDTGLTWISGQTGDQFNCRRVN